MSAVTDAISVAARLDPIRLRWVMGAEGFLGFLPDAVSGDWAVARVRLRPASMFSQRWEWYALTGRSEEVGSGNCWRRRTAMLAVEVKITELAMAAASA